MFVAMGQMVIYEDKGVGNRIHDKNICKYDEVGRELQPHVQAVTPPPHLSIQASYYNILAAPNYSLG